MFYDCTSLNTITIPTGVTSIGDYMFSNCTSLNTITIPTGVTSIGDYMFSGWQPSQTINVRGHANQMAADAAWGSGWRGGCNAIINYNG